MNFYVQFGNETKALYYNIHSKLAIKMEENRKCKKLLNWEYKEMDIHNKYFKIKEMIYYQQVEVQI